MSNRFGYRGYIASRPVRGLLQPQHVQNLVVRDYAQRSKLPYLLSATEYAMPGCYMVLESVMRELKHLHGVICYSLFMLPERALRRREIYGRLFDAGCTLHGALEGMAVKGPDDVAMLEDIFMVDRFAAKSLPAGW
ncbi:MAG TPA: LIC12192 family sporadic carbohydrate cluster protein [Candidatus Cybelea sp.]|nr:LIC12192 family sporadic carbohydrate cluster protein [Candidatus Cybelea sp.]